MNQRGQLEGQVQRWIDSGLIDAQVGARILAFEVGHERRTTLRWPVFLAMAFGGILLAAGITLFVAPHWSELSPATRFSLVLLLVALFHVGGALVANSFPPLSTTLHFLGTAALGAAIFLTAQIFNLHENWATGILLWTLGAAGGYLLLRDWAQAALLALLAPAWLISQWTIATEWHSGGDRPLEMGLVLTALCYLSARIGNQDSATRRTLVWIGGIALVPSVGTAVAIATAEGYSFRHYEHPPLATATVLISWTIALVGTLILAWFLRGRAAWINLVWVAWAYALVLSASRSHSFGGPEYQQHIGATLVLYGLCALGSVGLAAWGLLEKRKERINLGVAGFAISVLFFYFDSFMDKVGRSASLVMLGVLCLAGGYALEVTRRKLTARMEIKA